MRQARDSFSFHDILFSIVRILHVGLQAIYISLYMARILYRDQIVRIHKRIWEMFQISYKNEEYFICVRLYKKLSLIHISEPTRPY